MGGVICSRSFDKALRSRAPCQGYVQGCLCVHLQGSRWSTEDWAARQAWPWQERRGRVCPSQRYCQPGFRWGDSAKAGRLEGAGWFLQMVAGVRQCHSEEEIWLHTWFCSHTRASGEVRDGFLPASAHMYWFRSPGELFHLVPGWPPEHSSAGPLYPRGCGLSWVTQES